VVRGTLALERAQIGGLSDNNKLPLLDRPAGLLAAEEQAGRKRGALLSGAGAVPLVLSLMDRFGGRSDPVVRQDVARLYVLAAVARYTAARGGTPPAVLRLLSGRVSIALRELANRISGPAGMLSGDDAALGGVVQRLTLMSPSISIVVGTDEIQRNVIGERVLGLPREPMPTAASTSAGDK
jgi:alkylation response protein AidB-like acyl-CoA dehydrogenase